MTTSPRHIVAYSGSRAEFGLQLPLLQAIQADRRLRLSLVLGGTHVSIQGGRTEWEVAESGLAIADRVQCTVVDTRQATPIAIGETAIGMAQTFDRIAPDACLVYADRFETFGAAIAATQMAIPTFHVEGGDVTEGGALDDAVRDAISRLAHVHLTTNGVATARIIRMGEEPWRVIQVGAVVGDYVRRGDFAGIDEIEGSLGIDGREPIVLFTLHPIPTDLAATTSELAASLTALAELVEEGIQVVATQPNNDHGADQIRAGLDQLSDDLGPNFVLRDSLGRRLFHGLLALGGTSGHRLALVGNSSAGVKEAGAFNCPCVNVGQRQRGRLRGGSVIDVGADTQAIVSAIRSALTDDAYRSRILEAGHPYAGRDVGQSVADVLATLPLDTVLLNKKSPHAEWNHQDNA